MSEDITVYLCRTGKSAVVSKGVRVDVLGSGEAVQVSTDEDGRTVVEVVLLRQGQKPVREVVARLFKSVGDPPEFAWPEITLAFEPTFPDLVDSTWDITFTTPDYCRYFGWGLYRWSGAPGACCSNFDIPIALEVPGLPNGTPLPLSRSDAAPKAGKKHSIQLIDDPPYPGDLYCLYGNVVLPADDEGNLVYYPLASVVFGTNCFTGGVVREVIETDDGYEYMVQSAARAENGHALDVLRVRPSDNRRYAVGEWVTIHVDSAQCRHARPGIDTVWVVADDTASGGRVPNVVPLSPGGSRTGVTGCGGSIDYGSLGQGAMQRARVYTGMIIEIHRDRDPVVADVYLAAFGRVDGVKFYYHCEADNDRSPSDAKFMADAHSAFEADDIVRVLHVSGRRFETEAVTADALKIIGFADGKPRPCVKQFLLFYRSGGAAKMASFDFTGGQMSVIRHGDAADQGFAGITDRMVTYEKELRPSGAESTSILMGVPFEIADDGWMYTGFDPVYTDAFIAKYKNDDDALRDKKLSYGIFRANTQTFTPLMTSGNPYACAGFGYSNDDIYFYGMGESSFNGTWKYAGYHFYHLDINDFDIKCHSQRALRCSPTAIGSDGKIYHPVPQSVQNDEGVANVSDHAELSVRSSSLIGHTLYRYAGGQYMFSFENPNDALAVLVDGRSSRGISHEDAVGSGGCVESAILKYAYHDCVNNIENDGIFMRSASAVNIREDDDPWYPFLYNAEKEAGIDFCKIRGKYIWHLTYRQVDAEHPQFPGVQPPILWTVESYEENSWEISHEGNILLSPVEYVHWIMGESRTTGGDGGCIFPLAFPFGIASQLFAIKTEWTFQHVWSYLSDAVQSQTVSVASKTLMTPYGETVLSASSRPMGWTQIQTEDNEHVLQGVLIINDETSAVEDAMLWHNGTRIEAALATAVGCEVTDLLGVLYIPKVSVGGESSELPADEETSNGPSGYRDFCTAYPDHPACVYNGCTAMEYSDDLLNTLQEINDAVNAAHEYQSDALLYKKLEFWSVMGDGESGDCEDFALTKVGALIAAGIPAGAIKLVVGKMPTDGGGHAWVEVQTTNGNYSLDINYTKVQPTGSLPYTDVQRQYDGPWWV